jgi:hypothetical protein
MYATCLAYGLIAAPAVIWVVRRSLAQIEARGRQGETANVAMP